MSDLFYQGGSLFMGLLTLLLLIILCLATVAFTKLLKGKETATEQLSPLLTYIKSVGIFALVTGILGQLIGLYSASKLIESSEMVTPDMLAFGFRVSSISTLYGLIVFLFAYLIWFALNIWFNRLLTRE